MKTRLKLKLLIARLIVFAVAMVPVVSLQAQTAQDDYALAAGHYSRGNWDESAAAFLDVQRSYPKSDESIAAQFFLAEVTMQQGEFNHAYRAFQIFLQENPKHQYAPRANFRMGEAAYRTGKYDVALRVLEEFVRLNPHHELAEFALPYLGEIRLMREEPQLAQRAFETALRLYPAGQISNNSRLGLAKALQMQGQESEAVRFYDFLISQAGDELFGESHLQMGILSFGHVDYDSAEQHLTIALNQCKSKHSRAEATYWLARTHNELADYDRAIELLKTVVNEDLPEKLSAAVLFDGAVAASKTEKDLLALRWLTVLREKYPNNTLADESLRMAIDIHQRRGDSDKALVLIQQFRKRHKNSSMRPSVLEAEGRSHYAAHRYEKAIEVFEVLLEETEGDQHAELADRANWFYLKSLGHLGLGDFERAETTLAKVDPLVQSEQLKPLVPIARATARFGMGKYSDAIGNYRSYLQLAPGGAEQKRARAELTICLAESKRWDEAAAAFEDLAEHHEQDPIVLATAKFLAERSYEQEHPQYAERWFTVMARPGNPKEFVARGLSGLAWIKMEAKDEPSAHAVFERLLVECPDSKFSGEAAMARAKYLEDQKEFEQAAQMYGLVIRRFGSNPMANIAKLRRAYALQRVGGKVGLEESKTLLVEYLALPDDNPLEDEALYQLAWVLHDLDDPTESRMKFAELVESHPASKYWSDAAYRLVQHAVSIGDLETAKPLIAKLLIRTDAPTEVVTRALFLQGQIAAADNQWEDVSVAMRNLIARTDDKALKAKAEYWLAESLYRKKQYGQALAIFSSLIPRVGKLDAKLEPWVWLRTSQCHGYEGNWNRAADLADTANEKFAGFKAGYEFDYVMGRASEDEGKLSDARVAYQRVIDSPEGSTTETAAMAQWRVGETYFHQENYVEAIKAYHKVDSLYSYVHWRSAALIQAGKCQEHLHNNKHAIKLYTQLIESFPETEFASDARQRLERLTKREKNLGQAKLSNESKPGKNRR